MVEDSKDSKDIESEERIDFCLSKCGEGYCNAMTTRRQPGDYPCIEFVCAFCKTKGDPVHTCEFCKGKQNPGVKDFGKERQKIYDSVPKLDINDLSENQKQNLLNSSFILVLSEALNICSKNEDLLRENARLKVDNRILMEKMRRAFPEDNPVSTTVVNTDALPEDQKPGCFGAIGKGIFRCRRDCRNGKGCRWEPRCRQSQTDY